MEIKTLFNIGEEIIVDDQACLIEGITVDKEGVSYQVESIWGRKDIYEKNINAAALTKLIAEKEEKFYYLNDNFKSGMKALIDFRDLAQAREKS